MASSRYRITVKPHGEVWDFVVDVRRRGKWHRYSVSAEVYPTREIATRHAEYMQDLIKPEWEADVVVKKGKADGN